MAKTIEKNGKKFTFLNLGEKAKKSKEELRTNFI